MLNFSEDLDLVCCIDCSGHLKADKNKAELTCADCGKRYPIVENVPYFCMIKKNVVPAAGLSSAEDKSSWSKWRQQNFEFSKNVLKDVSRKDVIVDIGSGRGHFRQLFSDFKKRLAIDFYPYPGVDVVADITQKIPICSDLADVILLSNVLEHTPEPQRLLTECHRILKPGGGRLIILVPFIIKIHQAPYDFYRYTAFALEYLLDRAGFKKYAITSLGDLLDIHELIHTATIKRISKSVRTRRAKLELRMIHKSQHWIAVRLRKIAKDISQDPDYIQGYGCLAFK
jgi:SAM-dependent methyltransferase